MEFLEAPAFTRYVSGYLTDDAYRELQNRLAAARNIETLLSSRLGRPRSLRSRGNRGGEGDEQEKDFRRNDGRCSSDEKPSRGQNHGATYNVEAARLPKVDSKLIRDTRKRLHCSRAVFARKLRINERTLEKWEQGRAKPNPQAAALVLLVRKYPDTLERLERVAAG